MIQTVVPDRSAGDVFTEQMWDTYIKDNLNNLGSLETSLPVSPRDGQVIHYLADADGTMWQLRYNDNGGSPATYPWHFVGGMSRWEEITTQESTASGTFVDLATVGPSITIPFDGDYLVEWGFKASGTTATGLYYCGVKRGAAATSFNDSIVVQPAGANYVGAGQTMRPKFFTGLAAGDVLKLQYVVNAGTGNFDTRWIKVLPVRVG